MEGVIAPKSTGRLSMQIEQALSAEYERHRERFRVAAVIARVAATRARLAKLTGNAPTN